MATPHQNLMPSKMDGVKMTETATRGAQRVGRRMISPLYFPTQPHSDGRDSYAVDMRCIVFLSLWSYVKESSCKINI